MFQHKFRALEKHIIFMNHDVYNVKNITIIAIVWGNTILFLLIFFHIVLSEMNHR